MSARVPVVLACLAGVACGGSPPPETRPAPGISTSIMYLGLELPVAGTVLGGHYAGNNLRQNSYQLNDGARTRWAMGARERGEAILRGAGFQVRTINPATSDAQALFGVQYGLSGQVHQLNVRTTGTAEPFHVEVQALIGWELLDLGSGTAVFGRELEGTMRATGGVEEIIGQALDDAMARLVADQLFRNAIAVPRSVPGGDRPVTFTRAIPGPDEPLTIGPDDQLVFPDSGPVGRIVAGVVLLRGRDHALGTAFVITKDGLAIADAHAVRGFDRVRARLPSGVDRPVRLLRRGRSLDFALVQLACPGECTTVDWEAPPGVPVFTNVVAVGAPAREGDPGTVSFGRVGGRWGLANGVTLEGMEDIVGGEPVGRTSSGKVFGVVSVRRGRRVVLMLSEVFRSLKIQVAPAPGRPGT